MCCEDSGMLCMHIPVTRRCICVMCKSFREFFILEDSVYIFLLMSLVSIAKVI